MLTPQSSNLSDILIVVVEDDPLQLRLIELACNHIGLPCDSYKGFRTAVQARSFLEDASHSQSLAKSTTVLITDLRMPELNGLQLLAWIRSNQIYKNIPVYIWTSDPPPGTKEKARQLNCTALWPKFTSFDQLCSLLRSVIAN